jgi:hypothetical protein
MAERQVTIRVKADGSNVVQTFRLMGKEGELALTNIRKAANGQRESLDNLGRSMARTRSQGAAFNGGMRNVSLQLSQVAQQTQATGNFVQALAIQLPDMALGFGTVGIAAGVIAGVALPLVANALFDTTEKGGELKDQLTELDAATKNYQAAVERLRSPLTDLREEFGENASAARRLFEVQAEFARLDALTALSRSREALAGRFGDVSAVSAEAARDAVQIIREMERLNAAPVNAQGISTLSDRELAANVRRVRELQEAFAQVVPAITRIQDELGVSEEVAGEFLSTLVQLREAEDNAGRIAANERLVQLYSEAVSKNGELSDEQRTTFEALLQSLEAMIRFDSTTESAAKKAGDGARNVREMADEMSRAASEAIRFVSNLGSRSLAGVRAEVAALEGGGSRVAGQVARREADIRASDEFQAAMQGPEGLRKAAIDGLQRELELTREAAELDERRAAALRDLNGTQVARRGGAAQSLADLNEQARQADALIRQARQAAVSYAEVVSLLDEALRAGKISQEEYNRALDLAKDRFGGVGEGARAAQDEIKRFARAAVTDIDNIGDALDQLGNRLLSRGIDSLIDGAFAALSGGAGRSTGGLFGLGNFLGFLDAGGPIRSGEFAVVGERRPEIVVGPAQVIGGADTARLMGGGAQRARIEVVARVEDGNITQTVRQIAGDVALQVSGAALEQYDKETLPGSVQRIERDPLRVG